MSQPRQPVEVRLKGSAACAVLDPAERSTFACLASLLLPLSLHPADAAVLPPFVMDRLVTRQEMVFR